MLSTLHCGKHLSRQLNTTKLLQTAIRSMSVCHNRSSNMDSSKFSLPDRYAGFGSSVWNEFIKLAVKHRPLNLGQGFPDFAAPQYVTKSLSEIAQSKDVLLHQYTRGFGHLRLVQALSTLYSDLINRDIDPLNEILVTSGAYEALYSCIEGHTKPKDEVIIIEPYFDCYEPMVVSGGGVPVFIPLRPRKKEEGEIMMSSDWVLDPEELASKFNNRTKAIIVNTPHNPLGKVFSLKELTMIADLCKKWDVLCISDEVYEWLVYKPYKHIRMAALPGMWERTITIGSAGKTFSVTGWKIGWAYGPENLMENLRIVHQNCVYTCPTPIQEAVARGFEIELERLNSPECYFNELPAMLEAKRDYMANFLTEIGMQPTIPEGGYFMVADWTRLAKFANMEEETDQYKDYRFAKWMSKNVKIQGIPPSAFYSEKNKNIGENYIRYCFIKKDENLQKACKILKTWIDDKNDVTNSKL